MAGTAFDHSLKIGALRILAAKAAMRESLPYGYVGDPALVLLLTLFVQSGQMKQSALCIAAFPVPKPNASRWVAVMTSDGLVALSGNEDVVVALTDRGREAVIRTLTAAGSAEKQVRTNADSVIIHSVNVNRAM